MHRFGLGWKLLARAISSLAQTDAVAKLLIKKGVITLDEFMEKLKAERGTYQAMFQKVKRGGH